MAIYGYEAVDKNGKNVKGSMEGESIDKIRSDLKNAGMTVLVIKEQSFLTKDLNLQIGGWPTPRDLSVFCRQFVSMTKAGVSILDALKMLCEQTENKRLRDAVKVVRVSVEKGETLANSMSEFPKVFPNLMVNMVAAGEASGSLDIALERMSLHFERNSKTRALVKKAMIYPVVVCLVAVAVVIVMLVVVIPSYADMFEDMGTELPGLTIAVMNVSDFIRNFWFILLPLVIGIGAGIAYFSRTDLGKHFFGKVVLTVPIFKNLVVKSASSQMARTLGTLMAAGLPLVEAIEIVGGTMDNIWYKEAMALAKEEVIVGLPLSRPIEECGLFPPMVYHMIRIGEESGNTEEMLDKLADYYDEEVEMAVQSLMAAMEPAIIIVLAGIVGVLVGACMAPMLKMYETLGTL